MPKPRHLTVLPGKPGFYHCISRCVRRAHLCGFDRETGQSFDHRRDWMVDRIEMLTGIFGVDVYAYAIMSNHYHLVLYLDPERIKKLSDREIVERWQRVFTWRKRPASEISMKGTRPDVIDAWRRRLCDLSWFMKAINEPAARLANAEDGCKGHFWESRFKALPLLDEGAVLACMAYVDLNPVRTQSPSEVSFTRYTSVKRRIGRYFDNDLNPKKNNLGPVFSDHDKPRVLSISDDSYFALIHWTEHRHIEDSAKKRKFSKALSRIGLSKRGWTTATSSFLKLFKSAAGNGAAYTQYMETTGRTSSRDMRGRSILYRKTNY